MAVACLGLAFSAVAAPAVAQSAQSAQQFTTALIESSSSVLSSEQNSSDAARRRIQKIVSGAFDIPGMARYALGNGWDKATAAERKVYVAAFEDAAVDAFMKKIRNFHAAKAVPLGVRPAANGHQMSAIRIGSSEASGQVWIFRLRPHGESWRVVDVTMDGASALQNERANFSRILETTNNDMAAVIAYIGKRAP